MKSSHGVVQLSARRTPHGTHELATPPHPRHATPPRPSCEAPSVRASLEARGVRARHLHVRSARSLSYAPDACIAVEWRMACATAFLRASSELASLSKKVMNELRRSLGA